MVIAHSQERDKVLPGNGGDSQGAFETNAGGYQVKKNQEQALQGWEEERIDNHHIECYLWVIWAQRDVPAGPPYAIQLLCLKE